MKLSEHKISKVLKEQDTEKASAAAGETSGHTKLACYAVKILNENNTVASYENITWKNVSNCEEFIPILL